MHSKLPAFISQFPIIAIGARVGRNVGDITVFIVFKQITLLIRIFTRPSDSIHSIPETKLKN
jgi:hypothetical protein